MIERVEIPAQAFNFLTILVRTAAPIRATQLAVDFPDSFIQCVQDRLQILLTLDLFSDLRTQFLPHATHLLQSGLVSYRAPLMCRHLREAARQGSQRRIVPCKRLVGIALLWRVRRGRPLCVLILLVTHA
ncbi:hypothetical protein ATB53_01230 [Xanthomonas translucens]|uniref:Uncharacterized protein n=1 Tax=Xanthomonas campestris pv. translucens TaxID=343 RepID=A0A109HH61_XANCT|nr:hypothetical protein ATB53_01230 [Xanthomonas translucens]